MQEKQTLITGTNTAELRIPKQVAGCFFYFPPPPLLLHRGGCLNTAPAGKKWPFTHEYLTAPSRPSFHAVTSGSHSSSSPWERTESGGRRAATSTVPLSPPRLIPVVRPPLKRQPHAGVEEWWSMCNKCQCHGNPRFPRKIFLFIPFEELSTLPSRRHTTRGLSHDKTYFLAHSLID